MAALHLSLEAASAAEHAALAELVAMRGGRVRTIVRWLEHALNRPLDISVEAYPLGAALAEFTAAADRAREVAEHCPGFAEQLAQLTRQSAKAKSAEELAVLARQVTDHARRAVNAVPRSAASSRRTPPRVARRR
jgi:hypothetical protein